MIRYILIFPPPRRYPVLFFVLPHKISFFLKKFTGMAVLTTCLFFGGGNRLDVGIKHPPSVVPLHLIAPGGVNIWFRVLEAATTPNGHHRWKTLEKTGSSGAKISEKNGGLMAATVHPPKKMGENWGEKCASNLWHFPWLIFGGGKDFESFFVDASSKTNLGSKETFVNDRIVYLTLSSG